jgi:outer membrane protein assembly factor BamD (BamD/ComL family)
MLFRLHNTSLKNICDYNCKKSYPGLYLQSDLILSLKPTANMAYAKKYRAMRNFIFVFLCFFVVQQSYGQNLKKAFKYLEDNDFDRAKVVFDQATQEPSLASFGHYGNSLIFANSAYRGMDLYKSFNQASQAKQKLASADDGMWKKLSDYIPDQSSIEKQWAKVDEMLFQKVKTDNSLSATNEFIKRAPGSSYMKAAKQLLATQSYKAAMEFNTIMALEDFIRDFPKAQEVPSAQQRIYTLAYKEVVKKDKLESYQEFVKQYPNSPQVEGAKQKILEKEYQMVLMTSTDDAFDRFIAKYPNSTQSKELRAKQMQMNYIQAKQLNTVGVYNNFLRKFPESTYAKEIKEIRDSLAYLEAKKTNTTEAYKQFINTYPNAKQAKQVMALQRDLMYTKAEIAVMKKRQQVAAKNISKANYYRVDKMDTTQRQLVKSIEYDQFGNEIKIWERTIAGAEVDIEMTYSENGNHMLTKEKKVDGNKRYHYTYFYAENDLLDSARKECYQPCEDGLPTGTFHIIYTYYPDRNLKEIMISGDNYSRKSSFKINNQKVVSQEFVEITEGDNKKELKVNYQYDFYDQLIQKSTFSGENSISAVQTYFYDKSGQVTKYSAYDALGKIRKTNHYAPNGMLMRVEVEYPNQPANNHRLLCSYSFFE